MTRSQDNETSPRSAQGELRVSNAFEQGARPIEWLIAQAQRLFDAGVELIMIESEGVTENVGAWRTDVLARIAAELGIERVMFEAADPEVFEWCVRTFGNEVNLFVDHSQIVQLEALRSGVWGTARSWGRIAGFS